MFLNRWSDDLATLLGSLAIIWLRLWACAVGNEPNRRHYTSLQAPSSSNTRQLAPPENATHSQCLKPACPAPKQMVVPRHWEGCSHTCPLRRARQGGSISSLHLFRPTELLDLTKHSPGITEDRLLHVLSFCWPLFVSFENRFLCRQSMTLLDSSQALLYCQWQPRKGPPALPVLWRNDIPLADIDLGSPWPLILSELHAKNEYEPRLFFMTELEQRKVREHVITELCK